MKMLWLILALLTGLLPSATARAADFFTEDFEGHLYPNWLANCLTPSSPDGVACGYPRITSAIVHTGAHSSLSHYDTLGVQSGTYMDRYFPGSVTTPTLWMRLYYRTTAFTYNNPSNKLIFNYGNGAADGPGIVWQMYGGSRQLSVQTENNFMHDCPNTPSTGVQDLSCNFFANAAQVPLADDRWYCLETRATVNTPGLYDGILQAYVDDVLTINYTTAMMRSNSQNFAFVRYYSQYGKGDRYVDDWVVGTTRIGCGATPPADSTAPAVPTGFGVTTQ